MSGRMCDFQEADVVLAVFFGGRGAMLLVVSYFRSGAKMPLRC